MDDDGVHFLELEDEPAPVAPVRVITPSTPPARNGVIHPVSTATVQPSMPIRTAHPAADPQQDIDHVAKRAKIQNNTNNVDTRVPLSPMHTIHTTPAVSPAPNNKVQRSVPQPPSISTPQTPQHKVSRSPLPSNSPVPPIPPSPKVVMTSPLKAQKKDLVIIKTRLKQKERKLLSNDMDEDFSKVPWLAMLEHLTLPPFQGSSKVLLKYNIAYILNEGFKDKIPLLVVLVKKFSTAEGDATATLKDPTGEMEGTIQRSVLETFSDIGTGAVLALRKVSIFNPTPHTHYLNITGSNIVCVLPSTAQLTPAGAKTVKSGSPVDIYYSSGATPVKQPSAHNTSVDEAPQTPGFDRSILNQNDSVTITPVAPVNQESDDIEDLLLNVDEDSLLAQYQNQQFDM